MDQEQEYNWQEREEQYKKWKQTVSADSSPAENSIPIELERQLGKVINPKNPKNNPAKSFKDEVFDQLFEITRIRPFNSTRPYLSDQNNFPTIRQVICAKFNEEKIL